MLISIEGPLNEGHVEFLLNDGTFGTHTLPSYCYVLTQIIVN